MNFYVAPIVEGQCEVACIATLLKRIWKETLESTDPLHVLKPTRGKRDRLINAKFPDLETKIEEAFAKLNQRIRRDAVGRGLLLLLVDAEDDCPAELAPRLLQSARTARSNASIACVMPVRMLENWIVAGAGTLGGINGLPATLPARDAKSGTGWLERQLRAENATRSYDKAVDAEVFMAAMDLLECRSSSPSFDKLVRDLQGWKSAS